MNDSELLLPSVHWEDGITIGVEHFNRQERYFDSCLLWLLRYATPHIGLVGGGPRLNPATLAPESSALSVEVVPGGLKTAAGTFDALSVTTCRGITQGGNIVDLDRHMSPAELRESDAGKLTDGDLIFLVAEPHSKSQYEEGVDYDGQEQFGRRPYYELTAYPRPEELPWSLVVARVKVRNNQLTVDSEFIPPCAFISAHPKVIQRAEALIATLRQLANRFTDLHVRMRTYLDEASRADIMAQLAVDEITYAGRMVVALEECVFETSDLTQPPARFLGHFRRLIHLACVFTGMSVKVGRRLNEVKEKLQTDSRELLTAAQTRLSGDRNHPIAHNLADLFALTEDAMGTLKGVALDLEGSYLEFQINPSITAISHFFENELFFRSVKKAPLAAATSTHVNASLQNLGLSGDRVRYRIVLAGDPVNKSDEPIELEVMLNERGVQGTRLRLTPVPTPDYLKKDQFNFGFDFEAPGEVIQDLFVRYGGRALFSHVILFAEMRLGVAQPAPPREQIPVAPGTTKPGGNRFDPPEPAPKPTGEVISGLDYYNRKRVPIPNTARPAAPPPRTSTPRGRFDRDSD